MNFEDFKLARKLWLDCLDGKDRNSIMQQIHQMIWNTAVFKLINEARRIAPSAGNGGVQLNGTIHNFIDELYFENQLLAIRRLTDCKELIKKKKENKEEKDESVYSLISLIKDMKIYSSLMTRGNLFKVENIPYDFELLRRKQMDYLFGRVKESPGAFRVPRDVDWETSSERHIQFDKLSGVKASNRSPNDKILPKLFDSLENHVRKNGTIIKNYINKFVAHASTKESRESIDGKSEQISFGQIWKAQSLFGKIANFISDDILHCGMHLFLPTPQYDYLAYIDRPLIQKEQIPELEKMWDSFGDETASWNNLNVDDLLNKKMN